MTATARFRGVGLKRQGPASGRPLECASIGYAEHYATSADLVGSAASPIEAVIQAECDSVHVGFDRNRRLHELVIGLGAEVVEIVFEPGREILGQARIRVLSSEEHQSQHYAPPPL